MAHVACEQAPVEDQKNIWRALNRGMSEAIGAGQGSLPRFVRAHREPVRRLSTRGDSP